MAEFNDILKEIDRAITSFNKGIPAAQKAMYQELVTELRRLNLNGDRIKTTVANLKIIQSIKNKLTKFILNDDYLQDVKDFVKAFSTVSKLQNDYWKGVESTFKPTPLLREIRTQAIGDTVKQLTESGIGANIGDAISDILRTNITSGGSYKQLNAQLLESLTDTEKSDGLLTKYAKTITTDSINTYSAQYNQIVSSGIGFEWYAYRNSEIKTSRPFCQAMVENRRHFHVSEIPDLLKAKDLYYKDNKDGKTKKVTIYEKTGLPHGMKEGTNAENFITLRGGWNCGHQITGVPERNVPLETRDRVYNTPAYQRWKSNNG
jgi:hypothetical protein